MTHNYPIHSVFECCLPVFGTCEVRNFKSKLETPNSECDSLLNLKSLVSL